MMEQFSEKRGVQTLLDLARAAAEALKENGVDSEAAERLGLAVAEKLRLVYGGDQVYIPRGLALLIGRRDLEIYREFDGTNHFELARKHGLTERQVYNIIARVRASEAARRQMDLPFDPPGEGGRRPPLRPPASPRQRGEGGHTGPPLREDGG